MRSYGDKPPEFLRKVPSGLLPVLELDGQFITESLVIMQVLDDTFADGHPNRMIPPKDSSLFDEANRLLGLERKLFGAWCSYLFRPGGLLGDGRREFESQLNAMDEKLGKHEGPWFLPGDAPSLVDLQYVTHVERMNASCLYWKGLKIRGSGRWPNIGEPTYAAAPRREGRWTNQNAFRPLVRGVRGPPRLPGDQGEYMLGRAGRGGGLTQKKSDYYTHVMNIEPQYGPAFADNGPAAVEARTAIGGAGWTLPVAVGPDSPEPVLPATTEGPAAAKQEAAYRLTKVSSCGNADVWERLTRPRRRTLTPSCASPAGASAGRARSGSRRRWPTRSPSRTSRSSPSWSRCWLRSPARCWRARPMPRFG